MIRSITLGAIVFTAEQDGPLMRVVMHTSQGGDPWWMTQAEWQSLVAITDTMRAQQREIERLTKERDALRESLMHACELRRATQDNERQLWAMRQTANRTDEPFSHERVQERYESYCRDESSFRSQLDSARAEVERMRHARAERIAAMVNALSACHRKLVYLLRDYPDDKETAALLDRVAALALGVAISPTEET